MVYSDLDLVKMAKEASLNAYAPYSGYRVGAALLAKDNQVFTGCNVENSSYSLTMCAERNALAQALNAGVKEFEAIAVFADTEKSFPPCGACRQVLIEFAPELRVIYANNIEIKSIELRELLPNSFSL